MPAKTAVKPKHLRSVSSGSAKPLHVTLSRYLAYIASVEGLAISTQKNRRYILRHFTDYLWSIGIRNIEELTLPIVDEYIILRSQQHLKSSSINMVKQAIRHLCWYCKYHQGTELQFEHSMIKRSKEVAPRIETFTAGDIRRVIEQTTNNQDRLMIALMYETGVRIGELVKISVEDIHDTEVRVRGKGSKDRVVFMTPHLAAKIRCHTLNAGVLAGPIFRHQINFSHLQNNCYSVCAARDRIKHQFARSGIEMHPHQLRHSFAINWLRQGGDVRTLQKLLGHANLDVTMRYLQTTDSFTRDAYAQLFTQSVIT